MASTVERAPVARKRKTGVSAVAESAEAVKRRHARHLRNEILGLVAFGLALLFVYFTRHYAS
jgi:hypothetical protein